MHHAMLRGNEGGSDVRTAQEKSRSGRSQAQCPHCDPPTLLHHFADGHPRIRHRAGILVAHIVGRKDRAIVQDDSDDDARMPQLRINLSIPADCLRVQLTLWLIPHRSNLPGH